MTSFPTIYESFEQLQADWAMTDYERRFASVPSDEIEGLITPEKARAHLKYLGVEESDYLEIVNERLMGHEERGCIVASTGSDPRILYVLNRNFREIDILDGVTHMLVYRAIRGDMIVPALRRRMEQ